MIINKRLIIHSGSINHGSQQREILACWNTSSLPLGCATSFVEVAPACTIALLKASSLQFVSPCLRYSMEHAISQSCPGIKCLAIFVWISLSSGTFEDFLLVLPNHLQYLCSEIKCRLNCSKPSLFFLLNCQPYIPFWQNLTFCSALPSITFRWHFWVISVCFSLVTI